MPGAHWPARCARRSDHQAGHQLTEPPPPASQQEAGTCAYNRFPTRTRQVNRPKEPPDSESPCVAPVGRSYTLTPSFDRSARYAPLLHGERKGLPQTRSEKPFQGFDRGLVLGGSAIRLPRKARPSCEPRTRPRRRRTGWRRWSCRGHIPRRPWPGPRRLEED
jgi:hypothetical protein